MDHVPWLDETEMRIWRAFIEASGRVIHQLDASLKAESGLSFEDYEVLVHLSESDERQLRMSELSELLLHSQSRLTQRVNRLTERGLVCREKCPHDRRGTFAVLTPEGLATVERVAPTHLRDVRSRLIDLIEPAERTALVEVLERVAVAARASNA